MPDYTHHYRQVELALRSLVARDDLHLSQGEAAEVTDFIEHKEYGLALETLSAILLEHGVRASDSALAIIEDAALRMEMADADVVVELLTGSKHRNAAMG